MAGTNTVIFTDNNFEDQIKGKTCLVDFWGAHCPPCLRQGPIVDSLSEQLKDTSFVIGKMDTGTNFKTASQYEITGIPTLVILKNGEEVKRFVGLTDGNVLKQALENA